MSQSRSDDRPAPRRGLAARLLERPARLVPTALGLLIAFAVAGTAIQGLAELAETRREGRELGARIETLRAEAAGLRDTIERLENDPEALRLHAKAALDLVDPGETVVLLQFPESVGPPKPRQILPPYAPGEGRAGFAARGER